MNRTRTIDSFAASPPRSLFCSARARKRAVSVSAIVCARLRAFERCFRRRFWTSCSSINQPFSLLPSSRGSGFFGREGPGAGSKGVWRTGEHASARVCVRAARARARRVQRRFPRENRPGNGGGFGRAAGDVRGDAGDVDVQFAANHQHADNARGGPPPRRACHRRPHPRAD